MMKNYKLLLTGIAAALILSLATTSCQKDEEAPLVQVPLDLPTSVSLRYGEDFAIALPEALLSRSDVNFQLEFTENENVQLTNQVTLREKLATAITVDKEAGDIHIHTAALYPNEAVSSVNQAKIPTAYKATVVAKTSAGEVGRQNIRITITPASIQVKGIDNTQQIPFAYVLYNDQAASFELEANDLNVDQAQWFLPEQEADVVSVTGNTIQFSATAGDPKKEEEHRFDLTPALQKDGFTLASMNFRVVFIPQIKFFFGTYYPEYNLTILQNFLYIALSNGYLSSAPTLYPARYAGTFKLVSIEKDGVAFDDKLDLFAVNKETGSVSVKSNTELKAGQYKITVEALTTTGLTFVTDLTLAMEAL